MDEDTRRFRNIMEDEGIRVHDNAKGERAVDDDKEGVAETVADGIREEGIDATHGSSCDERSESHEGGR